MISHETFSADHIRDIQNRSKRDPALIERSIFALGLLEAIALSGLPFIFKGGTSLMLLIPSLRDDNYYKSANLLTEEYKRLSYIKKIDLIAYKYFVEADGMLT